MKVRILVVDDDPAFCEYLRQLVQAAGHEAHSVQDGGLAADRLRKEKFDAVFLDLHMPPPDGLELARRIRAPGLNRKTTLVMITGEENPAVLREAFEAGVQFFLTKPVKRDQVVRVLNASQASMLREKRRFQRVPVRCPVVLSFDQDRIEGTTIDLSAGGMNVTAARVLPLGTAVDVSVELGRGAPPFRAPAQVVRADAGMGLQFGRLSADEQGRLQEYLLPLVLASMEIRSSDPQIR